MPKTRLLHGICASTYDRDLFPTWITISGISGTCDTREYVIKRAPDTATHQPARGL